MEPVTLFGALGSISKFVDNDGLANVLADIGLDAAYRTLARSHLANDPAGEVRSAINSLLEADASLRRQIEQRQFLYEGLRPVQLINLTMKRRLILSLVAICYLLKDEKALARTYIDEAQDVGQHVADQGFVGMLPGGVVEIAVTVINPATYLDLRKRYFSREGKHLKQFWDDFSQLWLFIREATE